MDLDLEIHGIILVRLEQAPLSIARKLQDRLEPILTATGRDAPDIVVRFCGDLRPETLHHVGYRFAAFDEENFYVLDRVTGEVTARFDFDTIGTHTTITCTRGVTSVPLLFDILNVVMLAKGFVPLHASAVVYEQTGAVLMGWPKGGKTGAMLALVDRGARFVADEWVYLAADGRSMLGLPTPVGVSEWQMKSFPGLVPTPALQRRMFYRSVHLLDALHGVLSERGLRKTSLAKNLGKVLPYLRTQLKTSLSPQSLFGSERCVFRGSPDKLFLLISHDRADIVVEPEDPEIVARRMALANLYEQKTILEYRQAFRFAFPHAGSDPLAETAEDQQQMLRPLMTGKEIFTVSHPYGGPLHRLADRIERYL